MNKKKQVMDINIILKNEFKQIDDTITMANILKEIAEDLQNGLINNYCKNYEWHYIYKEI